MVKRVFNFFYREIRGMHQAAYILALFAVGSQILAIVRDRLLAYTFGAGNELDLYYAAFRIPDLLYVLFASVLSIYVLLPFVNKYAEESSPRAGARVLSQVFSLFLLGYVVVSGLLLITAEWYVPYLFPGFSAEQESLRVLLQILLLQPLLLGVSSLCGVVTQMNHRFILYALSPLLYNLGIIFGIIFLYPPLGLVGLVLGVVFGALGHLLIQVPFVVTSDFSFSIVTKIDWRMIRDIFAVSIPRAITLSINQLVLLALIGFASVMAVGSVSVFQFAFNLQSVPLAIIGMSYSVAAFPTLSYLYAKSDRSGFNQQLLTAMRHIIFWSIPIIGLVIVLRAQVVRVLLGTGAFDWGDTRLTAAVLAIFVTSLLAQAILLLLVRAFYAGGRTMMPLLVAVLSGAVSVAMALWLIFLYDDRSAFQLYINNLLRLNDVAGAEVLVLAIAYSFGQWLQVVVLMVLSARVFDITYRPLGRLFLQSLVAMGFGMGGAYFALQFVVEGVNQETLVGVLLQGSVGGVIGVAAVVVAYHFLGARELREIASSFKTKILKTDIIAPQ